jgi:hypothetical protein
LENCKLTTKEIKSRYKPKHKALLESPLNYSLILCDKSLATLLNISLPSATKFKNWVRAKGLLLIKTGYSRLCKYFRGMELKANQFFYKGYIYQSAVTQYGLIGKYPNRVM